VGFEQKIPDGFTSSTGTYVYTPDLFDQINEEVKFKKSQAQKAALKLLQEVTTLVSFNVLNHFSITKNQACHDLKFSS
jgi:hypothetical protein